MAMLLTRRVLHIAVWLGAVVMAGCGGGGGASPPPPAAPPTIATQPAPASVTAGQTATFNVTASGTAPLAYQWRRGAGDIAGATAASYTTPATVIGDNGVLFSVAVTNAAGSVTSADAALTVSLASAAPSITTQPTSMTVLAGATATFMVAVGGTAPLTYQWRRDGVDIAGASAAIYTTPATAGADDGAGFAVVVGNAFGSVTSAAATLTVTAPAAAPTITQQPQGVTVTAGQGAVLSVVATGASPLAYQWRINGAAVAGATASVFTIASTSIADNGARVGVLVSNAAGSVSSADAVLTVNPLAPSPLARYVPVWSSSDTTVGSGSHTLSVVDPVDPTTLHTVDQVPAGAGGPSSYLLSVPGGTYDAASNQVTQAGVRNLVYVKGGGLFRVNFDKGGALPVPARLSTETQASLPTVKAVSASGDDALISYRISGGIVRYVGLTASSTSTPRAAPAFPGDVLVTALPIAWSTDPLTGAIAALYWQSYPLGGGTRIFRTDLSFGNAVNVATFTANTIDMLGANPAVLLSGRMRNGMFFIADGALRRLDFATGQVRDVHGGVSFKIGFGLYDDSHMYLMLQTATARQLVRAADDNSSPGQVIASGAALSGYTHISSQTRDYLVFVNGSNNQNATSVRKTDGQMASLPPPSPPVGLIHSWITAVGLFENTGGNRVFYGFPGRIGSVHADGSDRREHDGNFEVGGMTPDAVPPHRLHRHNAPAARILARGASSLNWLELATGDLGVTVGSTAGLGASGSTLGPVSDALFGRAGAIGYRANVQVSPGTIVGRLDAIYLTDQAGSLLRLTNFIP